MLSKTASGSIFFLMGICRFSGMRVNQMASWCWDQCPVPGMGCLKVDGNSVVNLKNWKLFFMEMFLGPFIPR